MDGLVTAFGLEVRDVTADVCVAASQFLTAMLRRSLEPGQYLAIRYTERLGRGRCCGFGRLTRRLYDNALEEAVNCLYKAEVIRKRGPWRSLEQVELATAEWVDWWNHRRLHVLLATCHRPSSRRSIIVTRGQRRRVSPSR